jgi:hypothetical protein
VDLRNNRLEAGEKAGDVKRRLGGLSLVPQIIIGQKMRRRRDELTQRRPAEDDDGGVRGTHARGSKPFAIESRTRY